MQSQNPKKTKWERKKVILYGAGVMLAVFAVLAPSLFYRPATAELRVADKMVSLDIASNDAARERGLGGRTSMSNNKGMLFVFPAAAKQCFWMKDMQFPLDMVWLNSAKQVVQVEQNVSPQTYPHAYCANDTRYVIELNAGQVQRLGIHQSQTLNL